MAAPTQIIQRGGNALVLLHEDIRERAYDIDTGTLNFASTNREALTEGQAVPPPAQAAPCI